MAPTLQLGEVRFHLADILLFGDGLLQSLVYGTDKLRTMFDHLFHRAVLQEFSILVAIHAVIFILAAVDIRAEDFLGERHSAALAKLLFHHLSIFYHLQS